MITINPNEIYDEIGRRERTWHQRMLHLSPEAIERRLEIPTAQIELNDPVLVNTATLTPIASGINALVSDDPDPDHTGEQLLLICCMIGVEKT